jgi:drug/metabolite transporter (DMT)-like permease
MKVFKGSYYMILSSLCFALIGLGVKLLKPISNMEINFFKSIFALTISVTILASEKVPFKGHQVGYLLSRGVTSGIGIILFFITLEKLPLATANILQNTSPIFTAILGVLMLGERVSPYRWLFFAISFLGVLLTHKSGDLVWYKFFNENLLVGLLSALMMGFSNNLTAKMGNREHPLVIFNYSTLFVAIISGLYMLVKYICLNKLVNLMPKDWVLLACLGFLSYIAHYLAIKAYQLAPISQVSLMSYLGVPYALLIDFFILGQHFQWTYLFGISLVILGVLLSLKYA